MQPNELIHESSVYLKQHAYNPVRWMPWNDKAIQTAKELQKPILLSIGYAACHWCHVMEEESFSNDEVAAFMNEHFVNIKVDREERPDLDHIYMEALQTLTGSGGWPMNMFLTPEGKAFYGGTYFPPGPKFGRPSWMDVLSYINGVWMHRRAEVYNQADRLMSAQTNWQNKFTIPDKQNDENEVELNLPDIISNILKLSDTEWGGFGQSPKFPQYNTIRLLFAYAITHGHQESKQHAVRSVKALIRGGIYDHIGGGISRYSTDAEWKVPHFEKMLCDNAMLLTVLSEAYQITGDEEFRNAIIQTLSFCKNEMKSTEHVFYAAIDADSEGEEGLYYTWNKNEIEEVLGKNALVFCNAYSVLEEGNWEGTNILHHSNMDFEQHLYQDDSEAELLQECKKKLFAKRNLRPRPKTDTQQIMGWNALMIIAYCKAASALKDKSLINEAEELYEQILKIFSDDNELFYHTSVEGKKGMIACLDDYAFLIESNILLQEVTGNDIYLTRAISLIEYVKANFRKPGELFFRYTHVLQQDTIVKHVDIYDLTTPSGNSSLAWSLTYLDTLLGNEEMKAESTKMLNKLKEIIQKQPVSLSGWALLLTGLKVGWKQIAITGFNHKSMLSEVLAQYLPFRVLQSSFVPNGYPMLVNKDFTQKSLLYVCQEFSCNKPLTEINGFLTKN